MIQRAVFTRPGGGGDPHVIGDALFHVGEVAHHVPVPASPVLEEVLDGDVPEAHIRGAEGEILEYTRAGVFWVEDPVAEVEGTRGDQGPDGGGAKRLGHARHAHHHMGSNGMVLQLVLPSVSALEYHDAIRHDAQGTAGYRVVLHEVLHEVVEDR
jgi:hypothetical protein